MARPYTFDPKFGAYLVPQFDRPRVLRPNRTAAGMSYTYARNRLSRLRRAIPRPDRIEVLNLVVFGRAYRMEHGLSAFHVEQTPCPCCGSKQKGKLRLNERGRAYLRTLRGKRVAKAYVKTKMAEAGLI